MGSRAQGGAGGQSAALKGGGGAGGGGGYYGGGGGGGGSSYVEPSAIKSRVWPGWKDATGDGLIVIDWQ